jgi:hypothetical protein
VDMLEACREGLPHHEDLVDDHVGRWAELENEEKVRKSK